MADTPPFEWQPVVRGRIVIVGVVLVVWAVAIEARLAHLQLVQRGHLQHRADRQQSRELTVAPGRGLIQDRNGRVLARSVEEQTVWADPSAVENPERTAALLCEALADCTAQERQQLTVRLAPGKSAVVWRRQRVRRDQVRRIRDLKLPGVSTFSESRRYYPNGELAAHVLGYVGVDDHGLAGVEAAHDREMRGREGKVFFQVDRRGNAFGRVERAPTAGATLELTIDTYLQLIAERELAAGVAENRARAGTAVVLDPATGDILAMACVPTFNPNAFGRYDADERRNRAIQDVYEPGSTFKLVTASAALEERVFRTSDSIDVSAGSIRIGPRVVRDVHTYDTLSFADVIVKSSNVGAIKTGFQIGAERLGRYVHRFGFGGRLVPGLPGESAGIVHEPAAWGDSTLASVSMGYEISVTPLQMAAAVGAVANGGELVQPRVVRAAVRASRRTEVPRRVIRRSVSAETAAELTSIMEAVVERGTASAAQLPGYRVAGKTGTAAKVVDGVYSSSQYNASFIGFVPAQRPALAIVVVVDSPSAGEYYGGAVAAPIFRRIAEASLRQLGIPPSAGAGPAVLAGRVSEVVVAPALSSGPAPTVLPAISGAPSGLAVVPAVVGLSPREAIRVLAGLGVTASVAGDGTVAAQDPPAGTPLDRAGACRLWLVRSPRRDAVPGTRP